MRKTYFAPKIEVMRVLLGTTILSGSGSRVSSNVGLQVGTHPSDFYKPQ